MQSIFVIPCKFNNRCNNIISLVYNIRKFQDDLIVIIDSDSEDKSYFKEVLKFKNVIVEDICNKNYQVGAYWYAFKKYNVDFYYFLHDSLKIKSSLEYLKEKYFTALACFDYVRTGEASDLALQKNTDYKILAGLAIYGPIFFCYKDLIQQMYKRNLHTILPTHNEYCSGISKSTILADYMEGVFGLAIGQEGINIMNNTLLGKINVYDLVPWRQKTEWQYPIEKFNYKRL